jgi:hypothetical protein
MRGLIFALMVVLGAGPALAQDREAVVAMFATVSSSRGLCYYPIEQQWLDLAIGEANKAFSEPLDADVAAFDAALEAEALTWSTDQFKDFCVEAAGIGRQLGLLD